MSQVVAYSSRLPSRSEERTFLGLYPIGPNGRLLTCYGSKYDPGKLGCLLCKYNESCRETVIDKWKAKQPAHDQAAAKAMQQARAWKRASKKAKKRRKRNRNRQVYQARYAGPSSWDRAAEAIVVTGLKAAVEVIGTAVGAYAVDRWKRR